MVIKKLTLHNFRNYENESFSFSEGLNVLTGRNAQGKTNCAEAVFYLCTGASLRIRHEKQLIRRGQDFAYVSAEALSRYGTVRLEAKIYENRRELFVNGNKLARAVDLLGNRTDRTKGGAFSISPFRRLRANTALRSTAIARSSISATIC